jgi:hypothetical protein
MSSEAPFPAAGEALQPWRVHCSIAVAVIKASMKWRNVVSDILSCTIGGPQSNLNLFGCVSAKMF